jgi:protein-tyrosine phosphatase
MATKLYWINGPWPGKLALAARPRGGEWLGDEIAGWQQAGIARVVSLLTVEEERDLDLVNEAAEAKARGVKFTAFPFPDRGVPNSESEVVAALKGAEADLASGRNVVIHCRQGIGRSGVMAACLLVNTGLDATKAVEAISSARGIPVPETVEQVNWIDHYAAALSHPQMNFAGQNQVSRSRP